MIFVNIKDAINQAQALHKDLSKVERNRATARALNRTIVAVRTRSSKEIRGIYKIKSSDIKKTMHKRNANPASLDASLTSTGSTMPLMAFNPSFTKKGVTARIRGERKKFPGAFKAKMKSGKVGIFARAEYKNNKLNTRRKRTRPPHQNDLPITEVRTLAIPSALANETVTGNLGDMIRDHFPKQLASELKFRSMKAAGLI